MRTDELVKALEFGDFSIKSLTPGDGEIDVFYNGSLCGYVNEHEYGVMGTSSGFYELEEHKKRYLLNNLYDYASTPLDKRIGENTVKRYVKKRLIVEAIKYERDDIFSALAFCDNKIEIDYYNREYYLEIPEGRVLLSEGDYIIKGIDGEFYPCKADVFERLYDLIEE